MGSCGRSRVLVLVLLVLVPVPFFASVLALAPAPAPILVLLPSVLVPDMVLGLIPVFVLAASAGIAKRNGEGYQHRHAS